MNYYQKTSKREKKKKKKKKKKKRKEFLDVLTYVPYILKEFKLPDWRVGVVGNGDSGFGDACKKLCFSFDQIAFCL